MSAWSASSPEERLQPPLEDRDFLVAIHPLDLEDRLGVDLADRAGGQLPPRLRDVAEPLLEEIEHVLIVERVIDAAPLAAAADDPHAAHQAQLVRDRGFADPDALRDLVHAQLPLG